MSFLLLLLLQQAEVVKIGGTGYSVEIVEIPGTDALAPFGMSRTEMTYEAYKEYFADRAKTKVDGITRPSPPYEPPRGAMGEGRHPAIGMRFHGAVGFCNWLSEKSGQRFRLPTGREWEHAARAGATGDAPGELDAAAWHAGNSGGKTQLVGSKKANAFGLHDMLGNVWEYELEPFEPGKYDPVIRGGGWNTKPGEILYGRRQKILPIWYERDPNRPRSMWWLTDGRFIGFRVVRMGTEEDQAAQLKYRASVAVKDLEIGAPLGTFLPVSGTVVNGGDRTLRELEVTVFFLDWQGKALLEDLKARATFSVVYPVLVNALHDGPWRTPLEPGGSRSFRILVPEPWEIDEDPEKAGARVSGVAFAR